MSTVQRKLDFYIPNNAESEFHDKANLGESFFGDDFEFVEIEKETRFAPPMISSLAATGILIGSVTMVIATILLLVGFGGRF